MKIYVSTVMKYMHYTERKCSYGPKPLGMVTVVSNANIDFVMFLVGKDVETSGVISAR